MMEEFEQYRFYLSPDHIDILDKVDPNHSKALRTILDSKSRYEKHRQRKQIFDRTVLLSGLGLLFLVFSLTTNSYHIPIQIMGVCIIFYGFIGGFMDALRLQK